MAKTRMDEVRAKIVESRENGQKWREIGARYPGVPLGTLCRIAHDPNYEPRSRKTRRIIGLRDAYEPHPVIRLSRLRRILTSPYRDS